MPEKSAIEQIDQEELWDLLTKVCPQLAGESAKAYRAFGDTAFSGLSVRRLLARYQEVTDLIQQSYDAVIEHPPTVKLNTLKDWSRKFGWQQRLKEWRPIHEAYKRKQWSDREQAILQRWNESRTKFLDGADKLLEKADEMLKLPLVEKIIKRKVVAEFVGQEIDQQIVISPVKWKLRDALLFYKIALELMVDVAGDRQVMIDRLHADGYIITDPSAGGDTEASIEEYLAAAETVEGIEI